MIIYLNPFEVQCSFCLGRHGGAGAITLRYPMAMGHDKGHKVTKKVSKQQLVPHQVHQVPSSCETWSERCAASPHTSTVPWGWLKVSKDKYTLSRQEKVGTHICTKRKREELSNVLTAIWKAAARRTELFPSVCNKDFWNLIKIKNKVQCSKFISFN